MQLSAATLQKLASLAIDTATAAAQIIANYPRQDLSIESKTAGDTLASQVVTEVDKLSHQYILSQLKASCDEYELGLLSEEMGDSEAQQSRRFERDFFWSIDPLDGTLPFIQGNSGYGVSIALVSRAGEAIIGVVCDPTTLNCYHAIKGQGAYLNQTSLSLKDSENDDSFYLICDQSFLKLAYYKDLRQELNAKIQTIGYQDLQVIAHGGAVMNACWVLERPSACYFKFPKNKLGGGSIWDYSATSCLFKELGAHASDIEGKDLELNREASYFLNHSGILFTRQTWIAEIIIEIYQKRKQWTSYF